MVGPVEQLTRLERASGYVIGEQSDQPPLPAPAAERAVEALANAMLPALQHSPCLVSFSGGRDSSAVLALAVRTAARHGLPAPVPETLRFAEPGAAEESAWQELVMAHLGLEDWERIELTDELDYLGELSCGSLLAHGLQWPPNLHMLAPMLAKASGGALISGTGGDDLLDWQFGDVRARLRRPGPVEPRAVRAAGLALAPARIRAARKRRTLPRWAPWLRPEAERQFIAIMAAEAASEPIRWDRRVAWLARRREPAVTRRTLDRLASAHDTLACDPLLDRRFLATLAAEGGRGGYGDRSSAMRALFGDLLPERVLTRSSKADFTTVVWGPRTRSFAAAWNGTGIDHELVDSDALRAEWSRESPRFGATAQLLEAWLFAHRAAGSSTATTPN